MSIQFACIECNNTLEVPDGSEGQQAKCPACSAVVEVPTASTPAPNPHETDQSVNPFAPTSAMDAQGSSSLAPSGELTVQQIDIGWTFKATWELFKVHFGILIGVVMLMMAAAFITSMGLLVLRLVVMAITGEVNQPDAVTATVIGLGIFENVVNQAVSLWFTIGAIRIMLQISRNQQPGPWPSTAIWPILASDLPCDSAVRHHAHSGTYLTHRSRNLHSFGRTGITPTSS